MTAAEVLAALDDLPGAPEWVTLSGGNPALLELGELVPTLHADGRKVTVETQGSVWRDWLAGVDLLTVSPKPPSSGMATPENESESARLPGVRGRRRGRIVLKVVVFDEADYAWASALRERCAALPFHLSCGTAPPAPGSRTTEALAGVSQRYRWLCERAARDPAMVGARSCPSCTSSHGDMNEATDPEANRGTDQARKP